MKLILKLLDFIFGGLLKMTDGKKNDVVSDIEKQVEEEHKKILEREQPIRESIDRTKVQYNELINADKEAYKDKINKGHHEKNNKIDSLEKKLDIALKSGDIEEVTRLTELIASIE